MTSEANGAYETVIGLEVHVQLATTTKLFCGCSARFGAPPNTQVCAVCLGYPGALPVLNANAFRYAVRAALAFGCTIASRTQFDRKNYFYPDLPKGYQISQFDLPYATGGTIVFDLDEGEPVEVPLTRIHLEEDAGKSIHREEEECSWIDLNRCGTPLLEMVTEPEIRSSRAASRALRAIRDILRWIGVSDVNMEEGSLRCDVNVSLRHRGSAGLGPRAEVKNLNSFAHVEQAIEWEHRRQAEILDGGGVVAQETRLYDVEAGRTVGMRSKEEAEDYRYFPEPDLPPLCISGSLIEAERANLPELPRVRRNFYEQKLGLSPADARIVVTSRGHADYFDRLLECGLDPHDAIKWFRTEVLRDLNERGIAIDAFTLEPSQLVAIVAAVNSDRISVATGREVLREASEKGADPEALIAARGEQISEPSELADWVTTVISEHPDAAEKIANGDDKPIAFLMGQVMRLSRGQANPRKVSEMLVGRIRGA